MATTNHEAPSSWTSWNACSQSVRGSGRPLGRAASARRAPARRPASTSPSSAGTRPASASTCSTTPRTPRRPAASSSTRRGTRPATSGTSGSRGFGPGSSTAFASPDRTRRTTGIASTRTSSCWIPAPRRSFRRPDRDSRFAVGYDPSSPRQDLSFSDIDNAGSAPKCVVTHEDFDWHGDQPLRLPWTSTVIYELHVRGYTIDPSAGVQSPGTYRGLIEKIPYLKDLGVTAVELMPVQEFNEHDSSRVNPTTGERLRNFWGYDPVGFFAPKASYASVRERRRAGPGVQGDGPRVSPRGARGDPRRGLQPHRRRRRAGTDALASAASTTRSTTGWPTTSASTATSPARDRPSTRAIRSCAISSSTRCATG